jgi:hypothetical protein
MWSRSGCTLLASGDEPVSENVQRHSPRHGHAAESFAPADAPVALSGAHLAGAHG